MKVLFLTSTLPRFEGDQQAPFVLEQASAWKMARPSDDIFILAPHDVGAAREETINDIHVVRYKYMWAEHYQTLAYPAILPNLRKKPSRALQIPFFVSAQYRAAKRLIKAHDIDLIYAHWIMPQGLVAQQLHRTTGVPYILQNHSSDLAVFEKLGRIGHRMARAVLRKATAFFCVNSKQQAYAQSLLPDLDSHVLPMGLALDTDQATAPETLEDCTYAIGTISRLSRKKGLHHLISAAEKLAVEGQILPIAIAGDGEEAETLAQMPERADIVFPGFLTGPQKEDFFTKCFAMAFPSVSDEGDSEGLPVALLEALASGKPVIASEDTNIALLPEWPAIQDSVIWLDDPADTDAFAAALRMIVSLSPDDVKARARLLQDTIGRYRWDRLIEEYLEIIETCVIPQHGGK